jgi:glyoxylase-like metal-dependent hydrolase (beta-lactamase superfamily II)
MTELAPDVHLLTGFPKYGINWYVVGDVLIDAGGRPDTKRILGQLRGRKISAHALTHAHSDHQGASHVVCSKLGIPFLVPERDVAVAEDPEVLRERMPNHPMPKLMYALFHGPGHKVDQVLHEGDEVAGFTVLDTPGHSQGHVSYWRESDRVLICGDVITTWHSFLMNLAPGVHEPASYFTPDQDENRRSIKRIAELEPALVLVGHGPPLRDTQQLTDLAARLS